MEALNHLAFVLERQFFVSVLALLVFSFVLRFLIGTISELALVFKLGIWYRKYKTLSRKLWTDTLSIYPEFPYCYPATESRMKNILERYSKIDRNQKPAVMWFGPICMPFIDTWESVEDLIATKTDVKGRSYRLIDPGLSNGLIGSSGTKWRMLRRVYLAVLKKGNLESYYPTMAKELSNITRELKDRCIDDKLVLSDFRELTIHISYDITGPLVLGRKLNFFHNKDDPDSLGNTFVSRDLRIFQRVFNIALWNDFIYYNLSGPGRFYKSREKKTHSFIYGIVDELLEEWKTNGNGNRISEPGYTSVLNNFCYYYFNKQIGDKTWKFTLEELRLEAIHSIVAGIETIANSSQWTLYALGCHPEYQDRILQELEGLDADLSSPSNLDVFKNATFLEQCIKEALRHFPTVPIIAREITEDATINGKKFYKGTELAVNMYDLHHDPDVYDNPNEFNPDRFGPDAKRIPVGAYVPFGFGTRDCIGRHLAIMGVKLIVASILRDFKVKSRDHYNDLKLEFLLNLESVEPLEVTLEKR